MSYKKVNSPNLAGFNENTVKKGFSEMFGLQNIPSFLKIGIAIFADCVG
jgi:hypothetical protein